MSAVAGFAAATTSLPLEHAFQSQGLCLFLNLILCRCYLVYYASWCQQQRIKARSNGSCGSYRYWCCLLLSQSKIHHGPYTDLCRQINKAFARVYCEWYIRLLVIHTQWRSPLVLNCFFFFLFSLLIIAVVCAVRLIGTLSQYKSHHYSFSIYISNFYCIKHM